MATNTYVITGTSRGIGLQMTRELLASGNTVLALARKPESSKGLTELKERNPDRLQIYAVDVTSDRDVSAFVTKLNTNTKVDVLINNAGIYGDGEDFEKLSLDSVLQTIETNSVSPMRVTRALLPYLKKSSSPKVIHITSLMGSIGDNTGGGSYGYRMSKAALNMFNKSFAIEYPEITAIVMHPGWVQTDMGGSNAPTKVEDSAKGILAVCAKATKRDSGKFFDFEGDELPW
jgi:NAD(P)-dependent dehydrogenase (short-subunit alcohol dehydrogenase family)